MPTATLSGREARGEWTELELIMPSQEIPCPSCGKTNRVPVATRGKPRCANCQADLPWLTEATATNFQLIIERSTLPVLVDLWAPWCSPCRIIAPALTQLSSERPGALRIVKVNVDQTPDISASLSVQGIPTMILFHHGVEIERQVGAMPLEGIRS